MDERRAAERMWIEAGLFSYVSMGQRVPPTHPLRRVRALLDEALDPMSRD